MASELSSKANYLYKVFTVAKATFLSLKEYILQNMSFAKNYSKGDKNIPFNG